MLRMLHAKDPLPPPEPPAFPRLSGAASLKQILTRGEIFEKHPGNTLSRVRFQTILDHGAFCQEALGAAGALSNFRGVTV